MSEFLIHKQPKIIVLGASRVAMFRDFMFTPLQDEFHNCQGSIENWHDIREFTNRIIDGSLPKPNVVILSINFWWLKEGVVDKPSWLTEESFRNDEVHKVVPHIVAVKKLLTQREFRWWEGFKFSGRYTTPLYGYNGYGLLAIKRGSGSIYDGSRFSESYYTDFIQHGKVLDHERNPIIDRIKRVSGRFAYSPRLNQEKIRALKSFADTLKSAGIETHFYLAPFTEEAADFMTENIESFPWWVEYRDSLAIALRRDGLSCTDVKIPQDYGLDDTYMLDAFHPGEVFVSYIVEDIVKSAPDSSYLKKVNLDYINARRENAAIPVLFNAPTRRTIN